VRKLFLESQKAIDWLNKVISESILGSGIIRLLNSKDIEYKNFWLPAPKPKNQFEYFGFICKLDSCHYFFYNLATLLSLFLADICHPRQYEFG